MKLIEGLGNPGEKYRNNRHNVGFRVVEALQERKLPKDIIAKKTNVFMNNSGGAIKKLIENYKLKIGNLVVIHDDLDISLGQFKIQKGRGPKVHNGVNSVEDALGTSEFWRVRVGVDNRDPENRTSGDEYVLQDFLPEEKKVLDQVIQQIVEALWLI